MDHSRLLNILPVSNAYFQVLIDDIKPEEEQKSKDLVWRTGIERLLRVNSI